MLNFLKKLTHPLGAGLVAVGTFAAAHIDTLAQLVPANWLHYVSGAAAVLALFGIHLRLPDNTAGQ